MPEDDTTPPPAELLDCGQASQETKGLPLLVFSEMGWPPFDRALIP